MSIFTRKMAKEILSLRRDGCLFIPEGITEVDADFSLMNDTEGVQYFTSIHIPSTLKNITFPLFLTENDPTQDDSVKMLANIEVAVDNPAYSSKDGILFSKDMKTLICFPCGKYLKEYCVPKGVENIKDEAFSMNRFLRKVILPSSVKRIGDQAFSECDKLEEINIPEGVEYLGNECFLCSHKINRLSLPKSLKFIDITTFTSINIIEIPDTFGMVNLAQYGNGTVIHEPYTPPLLLAKNNFIIEEVAEKYYYNYFNNYIIDEDGIIWSYDRSTLIAFPKHWKNSEYILPETVNSVFRWAFNDTDLKQIIAPHSVDIIGNTIGKDYCRIEMERDFLIVKKELNCHKITKKFELSNKTRERKYVFISYSSKDQEWADTICEILENNNLNCWIAHRDIKPGEDWAEAINKAIKNSSVFVLVFSENSNQSVQVAKELTLAVNNRNVIIPFKVDSCQPSGSLEYYLSDTHWMVVSKKKENALIDLKEVVLSTLGGKNNKHQQD